MLRWRRLARDAGGTARDRAVGAAGRRSLLVEEGDRLPRRAGCRYSIGLPMHKIVVEAMARIPEHAWQPVADHLESGI